MLTKLPKNLGQIIVFSRMCVLSCTCFFRSYSASCERSPAVRDAAVVRKKRAKHKMDSDERSSRVRESCDRKIARLSTGTACRCKATPPSADTSDTCADTCRQRSRGWFPPSWPPPADSTPVPSSPISDPPLLRVAEKRSEDASAWLAGLNLVCLAAVEWKKLKASKREESEGLLSSAVGVLWRGSVKPLVTPSQATSVGKLPYDLYFCFYW